MMRAARMGRAGAALALALVAVTAGAAAQVRQLENGLARTPPMGFNTWNKFACNVSEDLIKGIADAMASNGMRDAGYQYVVIDDCWQVARDRLKKEIRSIDDQAIAEMKQGHAGWGPITILLEVQKLPQFAGKPLPSRSRIAAYLKQKGLVKLYEPHTELPEPKPQKAVRPHQDHLVSIHNHR